MRSETRLTREERRSQTRQRLLAASHRSFLRNGFHASSLDEIALEAGVTKGAVYSNFQSKADLFLAVYDQRIAERERGFRAATAAAVVPEELARAVARVVIRDDPDGGWASLLTEVRTAAADDPLLRDALRERVERVNHAVAREIEEILERNGMPTATPPLDLARLGGGMLRGLVLQRVIVPELSEALIEEAFVAFMTSMTRSETAGRQAEGSMT
jgi:AcrR family transcriptional regulator